MRTRASDMAPPTRHSKGRVSCAARTGVAALLILTHPLPLAGQARTDEYRLKAAFVYQFPQFVDWPATALQDANTVQLCVLRPNPFGADLERFTRGEALNGRPLAVRQIAGADALSGCHVLFAGARSEAAEILKAAAGRPILTVGEADRFLDAGGIIALKMVGRRVRFEVDADNARKAGLRISSQLLRLATAVRGGPL